MIPKVNNRGNYFKGLMDYLEHDQDRVAWTETRNLVLEDRDMVVRRMNETSQLSDRVEKPVEHISVSFDKSDQLNQAQQQEIADRLLGGLKLQEYQTRVVAHNDRDYDHFHVVVNRVHPTQGTTWDYPFYKKELQSLSRDIEREFGLRELGKEAPSISMSQNRFHVLRKQDKEPFEKTVQNEHWDDFKEAKGWADLQNRLAANDIDILRADRGTGGKVARGTEQANLSSVHRSFSSNKLAKRFGETLQGFRNREQKAIHRAKKTGYELGIQKAEIGLYESAQQTLRSHEQKVQQIKKKEALIQERAENMKELFKQAYRNPEQAWTHCGKDIQKNGFSDAGEVLRNHPGRYGELPSSWFNKSIEAEAKSKARKATVHLRFIERAHDSKANLEYHLDKFADHRVQAKEIVERIAPEIEDMRSKAKRLQKDFQQTLETVGNYYKVNSITESIGQRLDEYKGGKSGKLQSFFSQFKNPISSAKIALQRMKEPVQRELEPPGLNRERGLGR